jgi:hypothetical protein
MSSGLSVCPFPGIECRPPPSSILADSIRLSQGCLPAVLFRFSVYAPHIYVRHIFFS